MVNDDMEDILKRHENGKIAIDIACEINTIDDLRKIYTPGVAKVCKLIEEQPDKVNDYTMIGNTVCIATNGTAVLGLGDIGVRPSMPVMEGKSVILNKMSGVACMPILIDSKDADYFVEALVAIAPTFAAIMLEDISAPLCFEIEKKLQQKVDMPVFHDDQHGTACVVLAALIRALKLSGKDKSKLKIVMNGAGAAGTAICNLLFDYGFKNIVICDSKGVLFVGRDNMNPYKNSLAEMTNKDGIKGGLADVMSGTDIFIGISVAGVVSREMIESMNPGPIVLALANPVPEIEPELAKEAGASVALDGKMVNNALVFPGLMRGALDARASAITTEMKIKAAEAVADMCVGDEVVPDFMNKELHCKVADAVKKIVKESV